MLTVSLHTNMYLYKYNKIVIRDVYTPNDLEGIDTLLAQTSRGLIVFYTPHVYRLFASKQA